MLFPFFRAVAIFGAGAWVLDKAIKGITGRTLDENLDVASGKVIDFVRPSTSTSTPAADVEAQ